MALSKAKLLDALRVEQSALDALETERVGRIKSRDKALRAVLRLEVSHAEIAQETGLSRGRIGQLAQKVKDNG